MSENLYLNPEQKRFLAMAVVGAVERLKETSADQRINWTPESRATLKDMLSAGESLQIKLKNLGFDMRPLPPFLDGDEDEFLTKES